MREKLLLCFTFLTIFTFSQNTSKNSISFQEDFHDYGINVLEHKLFKFDSSLSQSLRIGYNRQLSNSIILSVGISNGFLWNNQIETTHLSKNYSAGIDVTSMFITNNGKIFRNDAPFSPYFSFGYQYYFINKLKKYGYNPSQISLQYGLGFNLNLKKRTSFQLHSMLNQQLNGNFSTHFIHRIGITQVLAGRNTPTEKNKIDEKFKNDYDKDGIADIDDKCPTLAGKFGNMGCPDGYEFKVSVSKSKLDSMEAILLHLKTKMEKLNAEIEAINTKLKDKNKNQKNDDTKIVTADNEKEIKTEKNKNEPENKDENVEIVKEKTNTYYVITISALNQDLAVKEAEKLKLKYSNVKVISQPNGFYRTAIWAGKDKLVAQKLLELVTENGTKQAWIAFY
ncbi:MAG: hypothetical protein HUU47_04605 [Bacteroidetes bacterium]|nr:hypothetical protein [Bacteroidota bacterium]